MSEPDDTACTHRFDTELTGQSCDLFSSDLWAGLRAYDRPPLVPKGTLTILSGRSHRTGRDDYELGFRGSNLVDTGSRRRTVGSES